jgi:hypothetical protein
MPRRQAPPPRQQRSWLSPLACSRAFFFAKRVRGVEAICERIVQPCNCIKEMVCVVRAEVRSGQEMAPTPGKRRPPFRSDGRATHQSSLTMERPPMTGGFYFGRRGGADLIGAAPSASSRRQAEARQVDPVARSRFDRATRRSGSWGLAEMQVMPSPGSRCASSIDRECLHQIEDMAVVGIVRYPAESRTATSCGVRGKARRRL